MDNLILPPSMGTSGDSAFFTPEELTVFLNMPPRWVEKNTYRIPGRTKVGRYVRYRRADIERQLLTGSVLLPRTAPRSRIGERRR